MARGYLIEVDMIYYLATERHTYTLRPWLALYGEVLQGRLQVLAYPACRRRLPAAGCVVFGDVERLSRWQTWRATRFWRRLERAGCRRLNHPSRSLRRYALQRALDHDFRVFRHREALPDDLRYPVFLRDENDHRGSLTALLPDASALRAARREHPRALLVEFLDTRGEDGLYRKYSAMRIGDEIIPRHVLFAHGWEVKDPEWIADDSVQEELEYVRTNPHEAQLRALFETARIDYGRIDYALRDGRIQTWEINTNPTMSTRQASGGWGHAARHEVNELSAQRVNHALLALDGV